MTKLPEWLLKELPEIKEPAILKYESGQYIALSPENEEAHFNTVDEAYDYATREWNLEVVFDRSLPEHDQSEFNDIMIWGERTKNGVRGLSSRPDGEKMKKLIEDYENFLKLAEDYKKEPDNFKIVYQFVDSHPAFWNRPNAEIPWSWMTYGHCALHNGKLTAEPLFEEGGTYLWAIETGSHIEPEYTDRYHDYKLDSHGKTIEEAYINLAKNIVKFYNFDGTQKENVPHIKPQWILDVEKSLSRLDKEESSEK